MTDLDTKPWYRQFWPWFIIALPASAVVASLYTVSLAVRTTDSLVVSSEDGMDVVTSRHLAAERVAADLGVRATLVIAELVSRSGPGPTEREHVVLEHEVSLARAGDGTWSAAIPLTVANRAPLSRAGGDGSTTWSVSWVVRITIDAPRTPRYTRAMPLVAVPTGIDPSLRPRFVEIPRSAR